MSPAIREASDRYQRDCVAAGMLLPWPAVLVRHWRQNLSATKEAQELREAATAWGAIQATELSDRDSNDKAGRAVWHRLSKAALACAMMGQ